MESNAEQNAPNVVKIINFESIDSTNMELIRMQRNGKVDPWTVVVADHQSAGRGRLGRAWKSDRGAGLWASVLVDLDDCPEPGWLPLVTGLAVTNVLSRWVTADIGVKWPNDVMVGNRKIAGILAESITGTSRYILGVGINFDSDVYPSALGVNEILKPGLTINRDQMVTELVQELRTRISQWRSAGWDTENLRQLYAQSCISIGAELKITEPHGESWSGIGIGVNPSGHLIVREIAKESGTTLERTVVAGDIVHATIAPCTPKSS